MRGAELECAASVLGLAGVIQLGYRDSGMPGSEDNSNPEALVSVPVEQVVGKIVKVLRDIRPQVVVTHDPIGGYRHPDHIAVHNATVKAFYAAGDPGRYPEAGPAFQPQKLYFHVMPRQAIKIAVKIMPLFGRDPSKYGKNRDIDLTSLAKVDFPIHALCGLAKKQSGYGRGRGPAMPARSAGHHNHGYLELINKFMGRSDQYMRAFPPPIKHRKESNLFQGVL